MYFIAVILSTSLLAVVFACVSRIKSSPLKELSNSKATVPVPETVSSSLEHAVNAALKAKTAMAL
jgi:Na+-transporting methylmalonyl-CoA/oxaloacetate decarboxylase gamma subunit